MGMEGIHKLTASSRIRLFRVEAQSQFLSFLWEVDFVEVTLAQWAKKPILEGQMGECQTVWCLQQQLHYLVRSEAVMRPLTLKVVWELLARPIQLGLWAAFSCQTRHRKCLSRQDS